MKRNDSIIFHKFIQLVFPAFGTAIAISLNEFVDSIMVSQLLGSEAMAIVNIGSPIMLFAACLYALFGIGGSIIYSRLIGEKKKDDADTVFGTAVIVSLCVSVLVMLLGLIFRAPLASILANGSGFEGELYFYLKYLFISYPLVVFVMCIATFLPAMNHPVLGSSCAIIANVVNLLMDYVFIKVFNQGVCGAAMATLFGYLVALLLIIYLFLSKRISCSIKKTLQKLNIKKIWSIIKSGIADASIQLGFSLAWGFCNAIASGFGTDGIVAFSFFMQLGSIISIFLAGICNGAIPVYALLYGADDREGIKLLTKKAAIILEICTIASAALFLLFPKVLFGLFDIQLQEQARLCMNSIIAFSIYAPFRSLLVLYRIILNSGGKEKYATAISVTDSIAGVFVFTIVGTKIFGVDGLWYSHVINTLFIILMILLINTLMYNKSHKSISPLFLFSKNRNDFILDYTITSKTEMISELSEMAIEKCRSNGIDEKTSNFAGILIEEMTVYTHNQCGSDQYIDILMKKDNDTLKIDFRSIGKPFNPMVKTEKDEQYNVELINKLVKKIVYVYAMGLNTTTLIINMEGNNGKKGNYC